METEIERTNAPAADGADDAVGRGSAMRRQLRRVVVAWVGGLLIAAGLALLVLPGPGLLLIAAGMAVLATEFAWAERRLGAVRERAERARRRWRG
jgi:hypothetical protein